LKSGEKENSRFKIGVEIEHLVVDKNSWSSINYYQENGIETLLKKLMKFDYIPRYENLHLVALEKDDYVITIEPAGQFEISIKPCLSIQEVETIYFDFLQEVIPILEEHNQFLLSLGYHPKSKIEELPLIPKKRYELMEVYLKNKGKYAHNMMKGTAALQISIDYSDEEDFTKKMQVANFISPFLSIIADNSPVFEGKVYEQNNLRNLIWNNMDDARCNTIPGIMDKSFGYQEYADYILNVEPFLYIKEDRIISTVEFENLNIQEQASLKHKELEYLFSMVFPVARARTYIEIRPGDSLPFPYSFSYIALIKGLFYNEYALNYLYQIAGAIDSQRLEQNKIRLMQYDLNAEFETKSLKDILVLLFDLARQGLPKEEKDYLQPLEQLILSSKTVSQIAKENLIKEGFDGLRFLTLNDWIREDEELAYDAII